MAAPMILDQIHAEIAGTMRILMHPFPIVRDAVYRSEPERSDRDILAERITLRIMENLEHARRGHPFYY
jgi:hypothetical protein